MRVREERSRDRKGMTCNNKQHNFGGDQRNVSKERVEEENKKHENQKRISGFPYCFQNIETSMP